MKMVGKRRGLLNYLMKKDIDRYRALGGRIGIAQVKRAVIRSFRLFINERLVNKS